MQAIQTKYLAPTNFKGPRVVAKCDAGKVTVSWDYESDVVTNHVKAAKALRDILDHRNGGGSVWSCKFVCGALPDGTFAHVYTGDDE